MNDLFHRFAVVISKLVGNPLSFLAAFIVIGVWAITGPLFRFSDTWQLVINTGTTIVTFLMVFVIQNTQNRDAKAMQLKLDELIKAHKSARDELIDLEDLSDSEIQKLADSFQKLPVEDQPKNKLLGIIRKRLADEHQRRASSK